MTLAECLYYLVREAHNCAIDPQYREDDKYFDAALRLINPSWKPRNVEILCLVQAANRRGRLPELDAAMERYFASEPTGQLELEGMV